MYCRLLPSCLLAHNGLASTKECRLPQAFVYCHKWKIKVSQCTCALRIAFAVWVKLRNGVSSLVRSVGQLSWCCAGWEIKAQASSREGAYLAQTGYCTWPLMLLGRCRPDVNKNGEGSGYNTPRYLCLTSEHFTPPSGFFLRKRGFLFSFSSESACMARLMVCIWHKSQSRQAASSEKHSGKTGHYDLSILQ